MLRVATEKEKLFYEKRLYPLQDEVFKAIQTDKLYLSGGTALLIKELPENEFNSFVKELIKTMVEYAKDR
ncbi:MAG: hypothetical protein ACOX2F_02945 [bacterium]